MADSWLRMFELWPSTIRQSISSPLQPDRLPDSSRSEFDYPVNQFNLPEARRHTFKSYLMWGFVVALLSLPTVFHFDQIGQAVVYFIACWAVMKTVSAFTLYSSLAKRYTLTGLSIIITASLLKFAGVVVTASALAVLATALLADQLCTHVAYLRTAGTFNRPRAFTLRRLWDERFSSFANSLRGAEGYVLVSLLVIGLAYPIFNAQSEDPLLLGFAPCFVYALSVVVVMLLAEWIFAILCGRQHCSLRNLERAFRTGLLEWHTYNLLGAAAPGVHQSPAGPAFTRRGLACSAFLLWGCVAVILSPGSFAKLRPENTETKANGEAKQKTDKDGSGQSSSKKENETAKPIELEPFEQDFLTRLSPAERESYLKQRKEETPPKSTETSPPEETTASKLTNVLFEILSFVLSCITPFLACVTVYFSLLFAMSARVLAGVEQVEGPPRWERHFSTETWNPLVDRLRTSQDLIEVTSLLLGTNATDDTPILVPRDVLTEHAHILGDSGSGKTSLGIVPLLTQLIRFGDASVIVVDLKADDSYLLETMRSEAEVVSARPRVDGTRTSYPFRWFTTALERSSYVFNPFKQSFLPKLADFQRTDIITSALGLQYGTDYGRKFFGDANYDLLNYAIKTNPNVGSFAELSEILEGSARFPLDAETKRAATNVKSSIRRLAQCRPFNGSAPGLVADNAIDLSQVFTTPQALYFALPSATGVAVTAEVARVVLYCLLAAAQHHAGKRRQVFLFIDEFQRIVAGNLELFLQTARSLNIGMILSNQSLQDLDTTDTNLIPAVRANTRLRQIFGAADKKDIEDLRDTSGETLINNRNWSFGTGLFTNGFPTSMNFGETTTPRLRPNDIILASDHPGRNIFCLRRGAGYAQFGGFPFIMDSVYTVTPAEFEARKTTPWPPQSAETITATVESSRVNPADEKNATVLPSITKEESPEPDPEPITPEVVVEEHAPTVLGVLLGTSDDPLDRLYHEQIKEMDKRRKKKKRSGKESNPEPPKDPAPPGKPL